MSAAKVPNVASDRDMAKTIAYMALGVAVVTVTLLGVYVYGSMRPMPILKELTKAQASTAEEVKELQRAMKGFTINVNAIEQTIRRDRRKSSVLDLKRSLISIQEVGKQAPASLRPKIKAIEEQLDRLINEVDNASPQKRIEIQSVR